MGTMIGFELLNSNSGSYGTIHWVYQENGKLYCKYLTYYSDGSTSSGNTYCYANIVYV